MICFGHPLDIHWMCFQFFRLKVMIYLQTKCFPMGQTTPSHGKVRPFPDARVTPRRSRIFVTSASTMHTLMSVLRFGHILSPGMPWDALGCPGMAVEILGHGQTADAFWRCWPFAAIATGNCCCGISILANKWILLVL